MHKRIFKTTALNALSDAIPAGSGIEVRPGRGGVVDEYVIEGPDGERARIDKLVELFDSEVE